MEHMKSELSHDKNLIFIYKFVLITIVKNETFIAL